jgi:hypothetical protein
LRSHHCRPDRAHQRATLDLFGATLATDKELAAPFRAFEEELYLPQEIEAVTGILASRVSELPNVLVYLLGSNNGTSRKTVFWALLSSTKFQSKVSRTSKSTERRL